MLLWSCQAKKLSQREVTIYQTLREAAQQQRQDVHYFIRQAPDSLEQVYQLIVKKATAIDQALVALNDTLVQQAGKGVDAQTQAPKQAYEITQTHQILKPKLGQLNQTLRQYNEFLKMKAKGVPVPDLKVYDEKLYSRYFEGAHLMQCLHMLQQIRNDVWFNANLVSQRLSY
ncbi:hypothetical protein M23134_02658 [Microscilla marina ATCC 23134]|uniref:Gliding motility-associated protein GldM N-terminal domain-containing protein n=2 Tax=Microscilla marina TaxID=1027 RepID=A1ZNV0_MICM2|nr:hypothetical protein M23134_02658 [Microscilla marina ATCC 23134]